MTNGPGPTVRRRQLGRELRRLRESGNTPPRLHFVLNEAVLRRPVGSAAAFRKQLDHLAEMTKLTHVEL